MSPLASYLVQTFVTLLAVVAVAAFLLLGARRLGVGRPLGPMRLVGRLPLDARRTVFLVKVADRLLVLGASEAGLSSLGEVPADRVQLESPPATPSFASLLASLRNNSKPSASESSDA